MKSLGPVLKWFGYAWVTLTAIVFLLGIIVVWVQLGFSDVLKWMSPRNVYYWLGVVITLAPGIGALAFAKRLQKNAKDGRRKS